MQRLSRPFSLGHHRFARPASGRSEPGGFKLDEMPPQRARGLLPQPSEVTAAALVRGPAQSGLGRP